MMAGARSGQDTRATRLPELAIRLEPTICPILPRVFNNIPGCTFILYGECLPTGHLS